MNALLDYLMNELLPYPVRALFLVLILFCLFLTGGAVKEMKGGKF